MLNASLSLKNAKLNGEKSQCINYIQHHLHEQIVVGELAEWVNLNESYLFELFKREVNVNITEYVM